MFDTGKDAFQKLGHTIILLHETPIFVVSCEDGPKNAVILKYWQLPNKEASPELQEVKLDEAHVDFRTLGCRLGYLNATAPSGDEQCVFVSRTPRRQTVQGINPSNLNFTYFINPTSGSKVEFDWKKYYKDTSFADMLKGKYPTRKQAQKYIIENENVTSLAFARWFAFKKKKVGPMYLEYKGKEIGWSADLKKINLSKAYTHLQETLEYYDIPFELTAT